MPPPNPKQAEFFRAREKYVCYGGARGGGKSWCVRIKALLMAVRYPGIRILILRRTFPELRENHILPMQALLCDGARYKTTDKSFEFRGGSRIVYGYCASESDVNQYRGQEYDVIFIDEATDFTEYQFRTLAASVRGANDFPKRMYLTCNPGGVGHAWVKRLFIDRDYRKDERPEDYRFIGAKVTDNKILMKKDPDYVAMLDNLPPGIREAWRDGNWDVFIGQYFSEWNREEHVCEAFEPPKEGWSWYVTMDYGLDMLAAYLIGVDEQDCAWVIGESYEGRDLGEGHNGLIVDDAAKAIKELRGDRHISAYLAPPDLWNARQETGRSVAQIFAEHGIFLTKTSNDRIAGWLAVRERLRMRECEDKVFRPSLRIFPNCMNLIRCLPLLQYDEKRPNDCRTEPHEITHGPDALRGFCVWWVTKGEGPLDTEKRAAWTDDMWEDYDRASAEERAALEEKWGKPR